MTTSQEAIPTSKNTIIYIEKEEAYCKGSPLSSHPGIYLTLASKEEAICPYCSQVFKKKDVLLPL